MEDHNTNDGHKNKLDFFNNGTDQQSLNYKYHGLANNQPSSHNSISEMNLVIFNHSIFLCIIPSLNVKTKTWWILLLEAAIRNSATTHRELLSQ